MDGTIKELVEEIKIKYNNKIAKKECEITVYETNIRIIENDIHNLENEKRDEIIKFMEYEENGANNCFNCYHGQNHNYCELSGPIFNISLSSKCRYFRIACEGDK